MLIKECHIKNFKGLEEIIIPDMGLVNAFYGKNNSGKSSILHAFEIAGLAFEGRWNLFKPMLQIHDLFPLIGNKPYFVMEIVYVDDSKLSISNLNFNPQVTPTPTQHQRFRSILIIPDPLMGLTIRRTKIPMDILNQIDQRDYSNITGTEMLYALKYYSENNLRGFDISDYQNIFKDIITIFPEIAELISNITERGEPFIQYQEYNKSLDLLYSGAGIKHYLDLFLKIILSKASLVLIDELEFGFHPRVQKDLSKKLFEFAKNKNIQILFTTHSPVFLLDPNIKIYFVQNKKGKRTLSSFSNESINTIWGDLGLKPGDLLQSDIVLLVEGQNDVIYFDYVINSIYKDEFKDISINIVQFGGSAADGIINGTINITNLIPGNTYRLWIRDRDASPNELPATERVKFKNALEKQREICHILERREIEFYFPESAHIEAQQNDLEKEKYIKEIFRGDQKSKFSQSASLNNCTVLRGKYLQKLLPKHLNKDNLDDEVKKLIEKTLIPWKNDILGIN